MGRDAAPDRPGAPGAADAHPPPTGTTDALATLTVTEAVIRAYAQLTDDYNPIHLDPQFAAGTAMGGVIAHGTMSIGLIWQALFRRFGPDAFEALELDVRFVKPVRLGETLQAGCAARAGEPQVHDVWVRGPDGSDRLAGTVRLRETSVGAADPAGDTP